MYNNFRDVLNNTDIDAVYAVTHTYIISRWLCVCVHFVCPCDFICQASRTPG